MRNTGVLLLHGLFEHKGRQKINAEWFEKLNIQSHLIDLPGHGSEASNKGDIGSWEENNSAVVSEFKNIQKTPNYQPIIKYFDKYESFCFDLNADSVLEGDLFFNYE